jgi:hypothetical protein
MLAERRRMMSESRGTIFAGKGIGDRDSRLPVGPSDEGYISQRDLMTADACWTHRFSGRSERIQRRVRPLADVDWKTSVPRISLKEVDWRPPLAIGPKSGHLSELLSRSGRSLRSFSRFTTSRRLDGYQSPCG